MEMFGLILGAAGTAVVAYPEDKPYCPNCGESLKKLI